MDEFGRLLQQQLRRSPESRSFGRGGRVFKFQNWLETNIELANHLRANFEI